MMDLIEFVLPVVGYSYCISVCYYLQGAGKSHTMKQLASQGLFPLHSYVVVDPDEIRSNFPEYHLYAKECPKVAGELTHTEAGYVTEIVTAAALQQGHNVLVDGSLRDCAWYRGYFKSLREEYGGLLRIAILHITASREVVFQRAAVSKVEKGES
jgi:predicted kinase